MRPHWRLLTTTAVAGTAVLVIVLSMMTQAQTRQQQERSDAFWATLHVEGVRQQYPDLESLLRESDVVVVGRIVQVDKGSEIRDLEAEAAGIDRSLASVYFVRLTLQVESAIQGERKPGEMLAFEQIGDWDEIESLRERQPTERTLIFGLDKAVYTKDMAGIYEPLRTLRELDGKVAPVDPDETFLQATRGNDFDAYLDIVGDEISGG